jgi:DNA anti-recombination protein RmuC
MVKKAVIKSRTQTTDADTESSDVDNVDKIRDILFGNQMREFSRQFSKLEKSLANDLAAIRKENNRQIESLKSFIESEIEIFGAKLQNEEKTRAEKIEGLDASINQHVKQIDSKIGDLAKSLDKSAREANQKLLKQSQNFSKELNDQIGETRERMERDREALTEEKVDKLSLSELLSSLAIQINSDEANK